MAGYVCIFQEGQDAERLQAPLAEGLQAIGRDALGEGRDHAVRWVGVREGFGFTAARPSTSTLVVCSTPDGFPQQERVAFMTRVCDLWQEVTGCTADEIVVTAMDGPLPL